MSIFNPVIYMLYIVMSNDIFLLFICVVSKQKKTAFNLTKKK